MFNVSKHSATRLTFKNSTFCPQSSLKVFCVHLKTNSDYFFMRRQLFGCFCNRTECVYCAVRTELLNIIQGKFILCRCWWKRGVRCGSMAVRLLGLRVWIPPGTWLFVLCVVQYRQRNKCGKSTQRDHREVTTAKKAVSHRPSTTKARVRFQVCQC